MKNRRLLPVCALVVVILAFSTNVCAGDLLNKFQETIEEATNTLASVCIINDNCYKDFFHINNYCCLRTSAQCCNIFDYIFSGGDPWQNFVETTRNPRPVNILILLAVCVVIGVLVSMIVSLVCYFFCGCTHMCCCCGQRKYMIVNH